MSRQWKRLSTRTCIGIGPANQSDRLNWRPSEYFALQSQDCV